MLIGLTTALQNTPGVIEAGAVTGFRIPRDAGLQFNLLHLATTPGLAWQKNKIFRPKRAGVDAYCIGLVTVIRDRVPQVVYRNRLQVLNILPSAVMDPDLTPRPGHAEDLTFRKTREIHLDHPGITGITCVIDSMLQTANERYRRQAEA